MLKNILVPLDASPLSEQALAYAQNVIAPHGTIILLGVLELPVNYDYTLIDVPMSFVASRQITDAELEHAVQRVHDYLNGIAKPLLANGYTVECLVENGDAATLINVVAQDKGVDAIVMSTHGRTGLNKFLFGSVTQKVMSHMVCPVSVVPGHVPEKAKEIKQTGRLIPATN